MSEKSIMKTTETLFMSDSGTEMQFLWGKHHFDGDDACPEHCDGGSNNPKKHHKGKTCVKSILKYLNDSVTGFSRTTSNAPSERDFSETGYDSESSNLSFGSFEMTKCTKKVHFHTSDTLIGFSEIDQTEIPNQKTLHEICRERMALRSQKKENIYSLFDNDPEFLELEKLTQSLTKLNESIGSLCL